MSDFYWLKTSENQSLTIGESKSGRKSAKDTKLLSGGGLLSDILELSTWADSSQPSKYGVVESYVNFYTAPSWLVYDQANWHEIRELISFWYCHDEMIKNFIDEVFHMIAMCNI